MLRVFAQAVAFLDRLRFGLEEHAEIYRDYDSLNNATQLHINNESVAHGDRTRITLSIDVVNGSNFIRLAAREAGPETSLTIHSDGYAELGSGEFRTQNFKLNGWLETALNGETVGSLTGTVNNLDPPNDSRRVRLNTTGAATVTGMTGASTGRLRDLIHVGAHPITLAHASGSSAAGNRFTCPGGSNYVLQPGTTVLLWADPAITGWRLIAGPAGQPSGVTAATYGGSTQVASFTVDQFGRITAASSVNIAISASQVVSGSFGTAFIDNDAITDAKLRNSAALSVIGRNANSTGDPADIAAGTDGHVLRRSGTTLGFGTLASGAFASNTIPRSALVNGTATSVVGRSANSAGAVADIAASADGQVFRRAGGALAFGAIDLGSANARTGTLPIGNGGTGLTSIANGSYIRGNAFGGYEARTAAQTLADIGAFPSFASPTTQSNPGATAALNWTTSHVQEIAHTSAGTTTLSMTDPGRGALLFLSLVGVSGSRTYNWPTDTVLLPTGAFEASVVCGSGARRFILLVRVNTNLYFKLLDLP